VHQVGFNFNFNLYKMHVEYNIKYMIKIIYLWNEICWKVNTKNYYAHYKNIVHNNPEK
jgi:hypothetical protein